MTGEAQILFDGVYPFNWFRAGSERSRMNSGRALGIAEGMTGLDSRNDERPAGPRSPGDEDPSMANKANLRGRISPLRPIRLALRAGSLASGRNDKRCEPVGIHHRIPTAPAPPYSLFFFAQY